MVFDLPGERESRACMTQETVQVRLMKYAIDAAAATDKALTWNQIFGTMETFWRWVEVARLRGMLDDDDEARRLLFDSRREEV
jgi:hypothetical protein